MLLLPSSAFSLTLLPLLVWINVHHLHNTAINHIPVGQLLCIILADVLASWAATDCFSTSLLAVQSTSWHQQQLYLIRWQLEQPATQQSQGCNCNAFGEFLLDSSGTTSELQLACCAAEAGALLLSWVDRCNSTAHTSDRVVHSSKAKIQSLACAGASTKKCMLHKL